MNCVICEREVPGERFLEKHHLIPKCGKGKDTVKVCVDCGDQIHVLFTEKELRDIYNTVEKLKSNERMQKWIRWIQKRPTFGTVCMKRKKRL